MNKKYSFNIIIYKLYIHFLINKNLNTKHIYENSFAHLYDIDAHGCECQTKHQIYYRTHHVYGILNQSINLC